jgi:alkanesulfonate monooxygenase SsuD/methylene tetrahydromethanopterin reductase-like flavin-dependent oxidoreductase (luciferase family)
MANGQNNSFIGTPTQVIEQIKPFIAAGVDYFMVDVLY